jgi:hypothetical protein
MKRTAAIGDKFSLLVEVYSSGGLSLIWRSRSTLWISQWERRGRWLF